MSGVGVNQELGPMPSQILAAEVSEKAATNPAGDLNPNAAYLMDGDPKVRVENSAGELSAEVTEVSPPSAPIAPAMPGHGHIAFHPANSYQLLSNPDLLAYGNNSVPTDALLRLAQKDNPGFVGQKKAKAHNLSYFQKKMGQARKVGARHATTNMATALRISSPIHPIVWFRSLSKAQQQIVLAKLQKDHAFAFTGNGAKIMMRQGARIPPRLVTTGLHPSTLLPSGAHFGPHGALKTTYGLAPLSVTSNEAPAPTPVRKRTTLSRSSSLRAARWIGFSAPGPH